MKEKTQEEKTAERKAKFQDGSYWDRFANMQLGVDERPTPKEAADFILSMMSEVEKMKKEVHAANQEAKCAHQEFRNFALEVSNLADKRRSCGKNSD